MAHQDHENAPLPLNPTAIAIDKDKHSQYAVRWAIDNLLDSDPFLVLIHVKLRSFHNPFVHSDHEGKAGGLQSDPDIQKLFTPYRGYCARKSVQIKEVVLEDADVSKCLLEYINSNFISNVVLGAGSRSFIKSFKRADVPTTISKMAPEHCSVYVVHKDKLLSMKSAQRPIINTVAPPRSPHSLPHQSPCRQFDQGSRALQVQAALNAQKQGKDGYRRRSNVGNKSTAMMSPDNRPTPKSRIESPRVSISDDLQDDHSRFGSIDMTSLNMDFSMPDMMNRDDRKSSANELEEEMRKLRLELKQTMDLYNTACKEALSAKEKAKELGERKTEEGRRRLQARAAEEEAMAMVEMEKDKCRAAMEAAEAAQRLAEKESQRRILAELKVKKEMKDKNRALAALAQQDTRYRKYTIDEIEEGTRKLSPSFKIGEGGYGPVYRGTLDHTPVAIKVLRPDAAQGRKQFQQEVEVLSSMRHPHMVLLLGACPEYGCLVYEFMNNGSLEDRLFRRGNSPTLPWQIRFKISAEIVMALNFLHQAKPEPLVHRDLKPANILLDRNYVSKISDVGLARLVPPSVANSVTQYHMTAAAGTFCYIDPEYQQSGMLTTKSDVYSLGIMLLQILTARPPMGLSHHVDRAIKRGNFEGMLDPTVPDWPIDAALTFAKLALKCSELRKKDRPDLGNEVLPELIRLREYAMEDGMADMGSSSPHRPS